VEVNLAEGKAIYESNCKACHGSFGEGNTQLKSPAVVNLDTWYLFRQVENFRNNIRGNVATDTTGQQMAAMVKTLKDTIAVRNVVEYIASLPSVESFEKLSGNWKNGEHIYQSLCGSCHGPEGKGNPKLNAPRLSGLASWYLLGQWKKFKSGIRGAHADDKLGAQMTSIVALVKEDQELMDVITYLRSEPAVAK
jgi:cytochrome c oxidase subunit 2